LVFNDEQRSGRGCIGREWGGELLVHHTNAGAPFDGLARGLYSFSMPLFDFRCARCDHRFEALVRNGELPRCPTCEGEELERLPSVFAVQSGAEPRARPREAGACGTCGDPRGPGACSMN
jgi:putative FmdB family regulatory protein